MERVEIFTGRPFLHCAGLFVYTFITAFTIMSDAHILSPTAGPSARSVTPSLAAEGTQEGGHVTVHESGGNEMHSRCFQMVLIYGRGRQIAAKNINCNLITFSVRF